MRKYNLGGPGGRVNPYTGMSYEGPATTQEPSGTGGSGWGTASGALGAAGSVAGGAAGAIYGGSTLDRYRKPMTEGATYGQAAGDAVGSIIPGYGATKGVASMGDALIKSGQAENDEVSKGFGNFFKGLDQFGTRMQSVDMTEKGMISEGENAGVQVMSTFLPFLGQAYLSEKEEGYLKNKRNLNATSTNVGGSSGLDGRTYKRGNLVGGQGGYMATGGEPMTQEAELEGREVVESPQGDEVVRGPRHEQGGVQMTLDEGDYVWSDRLIYKGKSMAEWYQMFRDSGAAPEQIEQLRQLQENLAGRQPGEPGGEQMALGGDPPKGKVGQWFDRAFGFERRRDMKARQQAPMATPRSIAAKENETVGLTEEQKMAYVKAEQAPLYAKAQQELKERAQGIPSPQNNPAEAYNAKVEASRTPAQPTEGAVPRWRQVVNEAAPYAIAGTGALAQIIAAAAAKNPYEDVAIPKAQQASFEPVTLSRVNDQAERAQSSRDYIAQLRSIERAGFGPSNAGSAQRIFADKQTRDAQIVENTSKVNAGIDASEKLGNMDKRTQVSMFNAGQRQDMSKVGAEMQVGKNSFESQRGMFMGDAVSGMASDALGYMANRNHAKAIYGNTGIEQRKREYSFAQAYNAIKEKNPNMSDADILKLVDADANKQFSGK